LSLDFFDRRSRRINHPRINYRELADERPKRKRKSKEEPKKTKQMLSFEAYWKILTGEKVSTTTNDQTTTTTPATTLGETSTTKTLEDEDLNKSTEQNKNPDIQITSKGEGDAPLDSETQKTEEDKIQKMDEETQKKEVDIPMEEASTDVEMPMYEETTEIDIQMDGEKQKTVEVKIYMDKQKEVVYDSNDASMDVAKNDHKKGSKERSSPTKKRRRSSDSSKKSRKKLRKETPLDEVKVQPDAVEDELISELESLPGLQKLKSMAGEEEKKKKKIVKIQRRFFGKSLKIIVHQ